MKEIRLEIRGTDQRRELYQVGGLKKREREVRGRHTFCLIFKRLTRWGQGRDSPRALLGERILWSSGREWEERIGEISSVKPTSEELRVSQTPKRVQQCLETYKDTSFGMVPKINEQTTKRTTESPIFRRNSLL